VNAITMPHVAATLFGEGPWYAAHSTLVAEPDARNVIWLAAPELPDEGFRWAEDFEVASQHITLTDAALAELLFCSVIDPANTDMVIRARELVFTQLAVCRCNLSACAEQIGQEYGEHPEATARRMNWCLTIAEQLVGSES
jgi:hypothetical protein